MGYTQAAMAHYLGVHRSTISRELKRNFIKGVYTAKQAQQQTRRRMKVGRAAYKLTPERCRAIECYLREEWSPEQVCARIKQETGFALAPMSLYRYLYADAQTGGDLWTHMRHARRKPRKRSPTKGIREQVANRRSIHQRPAIVDQLERFGDLELDTLVGPRWKGALASVVCRSTGYAWLTQCYGKDSWYLSERVKQRLKPVKDRLHTITSDNGLEFAHHQRMARSLKLDYYFADPYQTNQRARIEHLNKLVRQYIPKKRELDWVQPKELRAIEDKLNHRPRKKLGFKTPFEVFFNTTERLIKDVALQL